LIIESRKNIEFDCDGLVYLSNIIHTYSHESFKISFVWDVKVRAKRVVVQGKRARLKSHVEATRQGRSSE